MSPNTPAELQQEAAELVPKVEELAAKADTNTSTNAPSGSSRRRGRPLAYQNFKRLELKISEADFDSLVQLKAETNSTAFADVVRLALRVLYVLVIQFGKNYDVYLISKTNPRDKTLLKLY